MFLLRASSTFAQAASPSPPPELKDSYARPAGATGRLPATITLWQYEVCPYCCKVKAFLDYHKLPYRVIEVNPLLKGELKWSDYKKVPVVKMDDEVVVDSSAIISRLAAELDAAGGGKKAKTGRRAPAKPTAAALEEEAKWRRWVDDKFVKVVTANIYRNWDESWRTFGYLTSETKWGWGTREVARVSGALLMWQIGQRMPTKYGITGDLRQALYDACNEFVDAVGPGRAFMGGSAPNLADLAVFGVMQAVHRMGAFDDMLQHSRIAPWYTRMAAAVGESSAIRAD